jgi:putative transcriptional regulator
MTIRSHPSEATLLAYAAGTLSSGFSLAVAVHLQFCKACREPIATWEGVAGTLLDAMPESEMADDALARTIARARSGESAPQPTRVEKVEVGGLELPRALAAVGINKRHWIAPGIWRATISARSKAPAETYLIRLGANRKIPLHGHEGMETICVMKGSFSDVSGRYGVGDFLELDETSLHEPVAGAEGECICIISSESPPKMRGLLGWLMRMFYRRTRAQSRIQAPPPPSRRIRGSPPPP